MLVILIGRISGGLGEVGLYTLGGVVAFWMGPLLLARRLNVVLKAFIQHALIN